MMDDLDALFAQAKAKPMAPSAAVMARVLADAVGDGKGSADGDENNVAACGILSLSWGR